MKIDDIIGKLEGNLLLISNNNKFQDIAGRNKKLNEAFVLSNDDDRIGKVRFRNKQIHINKIRKHFKKKSINTIVVDYELIEDFFASFVKNSIYLNNGDLYFYNVKDSKNITLKYKRYNTKIDVEGRIVKINNSKAKNNVFRDNYYIYLDKKNKLVDKLSDLLTS